MRTWTRSHGEVRRVGWDPGKFDWATLIDGLNPEEPEPEIPITWDEPVDTIKKEKKPQMPKTGAGFLFKFLNRFLSALRGG